MATNGFRQEAALSSVGYCVYIDDLLIKLSSAGRAIQTITNIHSKMFNQ